MNGFFLLFAGQAVSVLGDFFGTTAQSVLVYRLTGSKVAMGTIWLCYLVPNILLRMVGGPLLDRAERRKVLMAADWVRAFSFAAPAALFLTGRLAVWHLFAFAVLTGIAGAAFQPVLMAIVPDLVPHERLTRANATLEGSRNLVALLGPAVGAAFVQAFGAGPALLIDAASFALSAVAFMLLRTPPKQPPPVPAEPFLKELGRGYLFFRDHPELLWLCGLVAVANMGEMAVMAQFLPYATEQLGTTVGGMGLLESAIALGALLGTFAAGLCGEIRRRTASTMGAQAAGGAMLLALGLAGRLQVALPLAVLWGCSAPFFNIVYQTIFQRMVPDGLRARVLAIRMMIAQSVSPFGAFLGGVVAEVWGLKVLFVGAGALSLTVAVVGWCQPALRRIDGDLPLPKPTGPAA